MNKNKVIEIGIKNSIHLIEVRLKELNTILSCCLLELDEAGIERIKKMENYNNNYPLHKLDCLCNNIFNFKEDIFKLLEKRREENEQ